jgi:segregation and condensation protein A
LICADFDPGAGRTISDFIAEARQLKLEVAADYLVMAAWLAYLKSALLLPRQLEEPSPDELALRLQLRLERLAAMREAGCAADGARPAGPRRVSARARGTARRQAAALGRHPLRSAGGLWPGQAALRTRRCIWCRDRPVVTLDAALHHLQRMIGIKLDWAELADFLPSDYVGPLRRSAIASSFVAALELARQGRVDLKQDGAFEPLYLKAAPMGQQPA